VGKNERNVRAKTFEIRELIQSIMTWAVENSPLLLSAAGAFSQRFEYGPSNLSAFMTCRYQRMSRHTESQNMKSIAGVSSSRKHMRSQARDWRTFDQAE
jgi:hypothetical protein